MYLELHEFNKAARILGRKYVPAVLEELSDHGWMKASDLSSYLKISTATVMNYLKELEEIDVLERREVKGATGPIWEYNLKKDSISIETEIKK